MRNEQFRECGFSMDHIDNRRPFQSRDDGLRHGCDRRYTLRLPGKTSLAEELVRSEDCTDVLASLPQRRPASGSPSGCKPGDPPGTAVEQQRWPLGLPTLRPLPTRARNDFVLICALVFRRDHMTFHAEHRLLSRPKEISCSTSVIF